MELLLTSAGVRNASIHNALLGLLRKPIAECTALCIPTAMYGHPHVGPGAGAWRFISGHEPDCPMCELGWKSLGVLELTALPSIDEERWVPKVRETDVLLVSGGDALYLAYWMRQSGFADLMRSLSETVYVGMSAGSMVMSPRIGQDFVGWKPRDGGDDSTLGPSIFRSSRTSIIRRARRTPWPAPSDGQLASRDRRTRSTTTPPSR